MRPAFLLARIGDGLRRNTAMVVSVVLVTMVSLFLLGLGLLAQRQVDTLRGSWTDRDHGELADRLADFLTAVSLSALALAAVMVLCAGLLISTTIRLSAWGRRQESAIMRMVGASPVAILAPFVAEVVLATVLGSVLAVGLLWAVVHYAVAGLQAELLGGQGSTVGLIGTGDVWLVAPFLVCGAVLLAAVTSWAALAAGPRSRP